MKLSKRMKIVLLAVGFVLPWLISILFMMPLILQGNSVYATVTECKRHTTHDEYGDQRYYVIKVSYTADGVEYRDVPLGQYFWEKGVGSRIKIFYDGRNPRKITDGSPFKGMLSMSGFTFAWIGVFVYLMKKELTKE